MHARCVVLGLGCNKTRACCASVCTTDTCLRKGLGWVLHNCSGVALCHTRRHNRSGVKALGQGRHSYVGEPLCGQAGAGRGMPVRPRRAYPGGLACRTRLDQAGRGPPPPGARRCRAMPALVQRPDPYLSGPFTLCFCGDLYGAGAGFVQLAVAKHVHSCACHTAMCKLHARLICCLNGNWKSTTCSTLCGACCMHS